jgi:hypothetical protein
MIYTMENNCRRLWLTLKRMVSALPGGEPGGSTPRRDCLARRYGECNDLAHCSNCPPVDQALRAATWTQENWQHAQYRDRA